MKCLPRSLTAQLEAARQEHAARGNTPGTSYTDTPSMRSAPCILLQPLAFSADQSGPVSSLQKEPDCAAQTLSTRNCLAQKQKGEAEMHITKDKGLKGEQKNLIFGKQERASKRGIKAMGMRTSFHG